jgi:hypothetical protein
MSSPAYPKVYFFNRASDNSPLLRVDTDSTMTVAEATAHCAAEYGYAVTCEQVTNVAAGDLDGVKSSRLSGAVAPPAVSAPATYTSQYADASTTAARVAVLAKQSGLVQE